jgi:hypothetical protein
MSGMHEYEKPRHTGTVHPTATAPVSGVLYSARQGLIVLGNDQGLPGKEYEAAGKVAVTINGSAYEGLHELRRGDRVVLTGEPVAQVEAKR